MTSRRSREKHLYKHCIGVLAKVSLAGTPFRDV